MKRVVLIGVVLALVGAGSAEAATMEQIWQEGPTGAGTWRPGTDGPYQSWLERSAVPTPDARIRVAERKCIREWNGEPAWACVEASGLPSEPSNPSGTAQIALPTNLLSEAQAHEMFLHEVGHLARAHFIDDTEAARIIRRLRSLHMPATGWAADREELLASGYASCALPYTPNRRMKRRGVPVWGGLWLVPFTRWRQACGAFRAAYYE